MSYQCIPAAEAARLVLDHRAGRLPDLKVLDTRDVTSYRQAHLDEALHLSDANIGALVGRLGKDSPVMIYCYHGNASKTRAETFSDFRFTRVYSVDGGFGPLRDALAAAERPKVAAGGASPELLAFLDTWGFDRFDLDGPRKNSLTPLMRAALLGNAALVEELLELGVDLQARNSDGNNALWLGCVSGQAVVVQALLRAGIERDNRNDLGATTLMYCASSGKADMLALLLAAGADPLIRNFDDARAGDLCATADCLKLLRHTISD